MASRIDSASSRCRGKPPEPAIVGIERGIARVEIARELIGLREHDLAVDRLDRPAAGDEPGGEPVEQLGMTRRLAAEPEVGRRGDDSPAEVVLPDPVDHHAGRQGIARAESASAPARAARCSCDGTGGGGSPSRNANRGTPRGTTSPGLAGIAPPLERRIDRLPLGDGVAARQVRRKRRPLAARQLRAQVLQPAGRRRVFLRLERLDRRVRASASRSLIGLQPGLGPRRFDQRDEIQPREALRLQLLGAGVGEGRAGEDAVKCVIVALADRVELVVVAAGAAEREPQEGAAGRLDRVFERQVPELERRRRVAARQGQKAGGDDRFGVVVGRRLAGPGCRRPVARGRTGRKACRG